MDDCSRRRYTVESWDGEIAVPIEIRRLFVGIKFVVEPTESVLRIRPIGVSREFPAIFETDVVFLRERRAEIDSRVACCRRRRGERIIE